MALNLSQKEKMLLNDQKGHEQICIEKYQNYAQQAQDPQLKQIFLSLAQQEQTHFNTINQIMNGTVPSMAQGQGQQSAQSQQGGMQSQTQASAGMQNQQAAAGSYTKNDAQLCTDMLMTEKYVSGAYDTAIFEFTDSNVRQALNHIQKEEQQHGEKIFNYMKSHGMYNVQ